MPFSSEQQRKFMWARHPEIAKKWAHGQHSSGAPIAPGEKSKVSGDAVKRRLQNLHKKKKKGGKNANSKEAPAKGSKPPWLAGK